MKSSAVLDFPPLSPLSVSECDPYGARERRKETRMFSGQRFERTKRVLANTAIGGMIGLVPPTYYMTEDVLPMRAQISQQHATIEQVSPADGPLDEDTATIELVGLGNSNAEETAKTERPYGKVWSVKYSNQGIDTLDIAEMIEDKAEAEGVDKLNFVGHSMGGIVALEVAKYIYEDSDIDVLSVVLDCTPIDLDAVRPDVRTKGEDMVRWVSEIPGARESRFLRFIVEMWARNDRFIEGSIWDDPNFDYDRLQEAVAEVLRDKILSEDATSNGLLEVQFLVIADSGARSSLRALGSEVKGKVPPVIIDIRPKNGNDDTTVDVDYTQRVLEDEAKRNKTKLVIVNIDNEGHANPNQRPDVYRQAIDTIIVPVIYDHATRPPEKPETKVTELAQGVPHGYTK